MADESVLAQGRRRKLEPPVQLPLPGGSSTAASPFAHQPGPRRPFDLELRDQRDAYMRAFENYRERLRQQRILRIQEMRNSHVIVYYSADQLELEHSETFAELLDSLELTRGARLDLFLLSPGGFADAAYKIVTLCRAKLPDDGHFAVLIPHYAKSAATLLAIGADELVMGPSSELGPIDPIVTDPGTERRVPALALQEALDMIRTRTKSENRALALYEQWFESRNLTDLTEVGEYERAIRSAEQYAIELLSTYMLRDNEEMARKVASNLTRKYYSHGYAISLRQARGEMGLNVTDAREQRNLWEAMWQLNRLYDLLLKETEASDRPITLFMEIEGYHLAIPGRHSSAESISDSVIPVTRRYYRDDIDVR